MNENLHGEEFVIEDHRVILTFSCTPGVGLREIHSCQPELHYHPLTVTLQKLHKVEECSVVVQDVCQHDLARGEYIHLVLGVELAGEEVRKVLGLKHLNHNLLSLVKAVGSNMTLLGADALNNSPLYLGVQVDRSLALGSNVSSVDFHLKKMMGGKV